MSDDDCCVERLIVESDRTEVLIDERAPTSLLVDEQPATLLIDEVVSREVLREADSVVVYELLTVCEQGPPGRPGTSEETMPYAKRLDEVEQPDGSEVLYKGEAAPGVSDDDPLWRISRIVLDEDTCDATTDWADGSADFDKAWSDRLTYDYR